MESRIKSCFPGYLKLKRNSVTISETSATTQENTGDIEFSDEHGSLITYRKPHNDNPNDTCNDFYLIHCQQGNDKKVF